MAKVNYRHIVVYPTSPTMDEWNEKDWSATQRRCSDHSPQKYQRAVKMADVEMPKMAEDLMDKFLQFFHGRDWPTGETYIVWIVNEELLKIRNKPGVKHAEICFLDEMNKAERQPILQDSNKKVRIKCYINWTHCRECANKLVEWREGCKATVLMDIICVNFYFIKRPSCGDCAWHGSTDHPRNTAGLRNLLKYISVRVLKQDDLYELLTADTDWTKAICPNEFEKKTKEGKNLQNDQLQVLISDRILQDCNKLQDDFKKKIEESFEEQPTAYKV